MRFDVFDAYATILSIVGWLVVPDLAWATIRPFSFDYYLVSVFHLVVVDAYLFSEGTAGVIAVDNGFVEHIFCECDHLLTPVLESLVGYRGYLYFLGVFVAVNAPLTL